MKARTKYLLVASCSFFLLLGLSGPAASTTNDTGVEPSAGRIGGPAGLTGQEKGERLGDLSAGARVGGQAGRSRPLEGREGVPDLSTGVRIGGQAGLAVPLQKRKADTNLSAGLRIGGQAGLARDLEEPEGIANN